jgi:hypothetical protein
MRLHMEDMCGQQQSTLSLPFLPWFPQECVATTTEKIFIEVNKLKKTRG